MINDDGRPPPPPPPPPCCICCRNISSITFCCSSVRFKSLAFNFTAIFFFRLGDEDFCATGEVSLDPPVPPTFGTARDFFIAVAADGIFSSDEGGDFSIKSDECQFSTVGFCLSVFHFENRSLISWSTDDTLTRDFVGDGDNPGTDSVDSRRNGFFLGVTPVPRPSWSSSKFTSKLRL